MAPSRQDVSASTNDFGRRANGSAPDGARSGGGRDGRGEENGDLRLDGQGHGNGNGMAKGKANGSGEVVNIDMTAMRSMTGNMK